MTSAPLRVLATLVLVGLVGLMIGPFGAVETSVDIWDKAAHFVAFGLILWAIGVLWRRLPRAWAAMATLSLGGAVELVQGQVGRDASWADLLADALGVAAALGLWIIWRRGRPRAARAERGQTSKTR